MNSQLDRIFLIGFMGAGKTSLGRQLAKGMQYEFIDLDKKIEEYAKMTISEIFQNKGEEYFRLLETKVLKSISIEKNVVISLGGGTPTQVKNDAIISKNISIYIKLPPKALYHRLIASKNPRPLLKDVPSDKLLEFIVTKLKEREPFYEKATMTVDGHKPDIHILIKAIHCLV
jgi:shikimate kinase